MGEVSSIATVEGATRIAALRVSDNGKDQAVVELLNGDIKVVDKAAFDIAKTKGVPLKLVELVTSRNGMARVARRAGPAPPWVPNSE